MTSWLLVAHVFGFVLWIGGLLSSTAALGKHAKASAPEVREALARAARSSLRGLADPGATVAILAGIFLISTNSHYFLRAPWLHVKLTFVVLLTGVHVFVAIRAKRAYTQPAAMDEKLSRLIYLAILLLFLSILIATLPGSVYLT